MELSHPFRALALGMGLALASGFVSQPSLADDDTVINTGLSVAESDMLLYMREEEKLAHDVYLILGDWWHDRVFSNIAESEQRHMEAVEDLLDQYGLVDPALDATGYFTNPVLQELYDSLVNRGAASRIEALRVGGLIEEVDITDIQHAIDETDHRDISQVYENLLAGSRNHLRAFVDRLERLGVEYEAQHLSQEEVDAIVESPMENEIIE